MRWPVRSMFVWQLGPVFDAEGSIEAVVSRAGAVWVGDGGGCASSSACAANARAFIDFCREGAYPGLAFWHWAAAPSEFWDVLMACTG